MDGLNSVDASIIISSTRVIGMTTFLVICFVAGSIGAVLQGMIGVGTGIIIVPLLTILLPYYGTPQESAIHIAIATSMAAIATNSITALISHYKRGNINWVLFKKMIFFTMLGSCAGALTASHTSSRYLQILFCVFIFSNAIYMLIKSGNAGESDLLPHASITKTSSGGLSIGFISSMVGSGGGVLLVPFLRSCKLHMRSAVGTSTLISFPVAAVGAVTYALTGIAKISASSETIGYLHWPAFIAITLAGTAFSPIGVKLATLIHAKYLQQMFAFSLVAIGIKMAISI